MGRRQSLPPATDTEKPRYSVSQPPLTGNKMSGNKICHPKISLWHANYLELKTIKTQKTQEETSTFSLTAWKNLDRGPVPGIEPSLEISAKHMGQVWWGKQQGWEIESILCPLVSVWPNKHLFTKHLLFHPHVNCLPPLWGSKPLPQHPLLSLAEDGT